MAIVLCRWHGHVRAQWLLNFHVHALSSHRPPSTGRDGPWQKCHRSNPFTRVPAAASPPARGTRMTPWHKRSFNWWWSKKNMPNTIFNYTVSDQSKLRTLSDRKREKFRANCAKRNYKNRRMKHSANHTANQYKFHITMRIPWVERARLIRTNAKGCVCVRRDYVCNQRFPITLFCFDISTSVLCLSRNYIMGTIIMDFSPR